MDPPADNITLKMLSEKLKLHVSTVSRVLNGSDSEARSAASERTVARIRKLAKEYNYYPNPYATGLKTNRSNTIGVLVPRITDIVLATIYEGIDEVALDNNISAFISNTKDNETTQQKLVRNAISRYVDGIIIGDSHLGGENKYLEILDENKIPFILVSRRADEYCSVTCDDFEGGRLAAQYLLSKGHRSFCVLAGESFASTGVDRTKGFVDHCTNAGITIPDSRIFCGHFDTMTGYDQGMQILSKKPYPDAVFAVNDFLSIGFMGAMKHYGLIPGKDMALIGYNDTPLAKNLPIGLTTVSSPMKEMGSQAMQLLLDKMKGKKVDSISLMPKLIVRDSA